MQRTDVPILYRRQLNNIAVTLASFHHDDIGFLQDLSAFLDDQHRAAQNLEVKNAYLALFHAIQQIINHKKEAQG